VTPSQRPKGVTTRYRRYWDAVGHHAYSNHELAQKHFLSLSIKLVQTCVSHSYPDWRSKGTTSNERRLLSRFWDTALQRKRNAK